MHQVFDFFFSAAGNKTLLRISLYTSDFDDFPDDTDNWQFFDVPTPGMPNEKIAIS